MRTTTEIKISLNSLTFLPSLAEYILNHRIEEYAALQIKLSYDLQLPVLKLLSHLSQEEMLKFTIRTSNEFLNYLLQNKAEEQIENGLANWRANKLPILSTDDIGTEDITKLTYIRKQCLVHFIPEYCKSIDQVMELIREIDLYCLESETRSTETYINLLKGKIQEHIHFIEKVSETTPNAVYVYDAEQNKGVYANQKLVKVLGYSQNELNISHFDDVIIQLIHPDDREIIKKNFQKVLSSSDNEITSYKYRIKKRDNEYRWISCYESVFKRRNDGTVWQTIGIILDVDKEEKIAEALQSRERQLHESDKRYKQAEALTHIGNYIWDLGTNDIEWSDELYKIYGLRPSSTTMKFSDIEQYTVTEDIVLVRDQISNALNENKPFDFYYRIKTKEGEPKILHARGEVITDERKSIKILGTVQDVTEKQNLILQLKEKEALYKQAEELANMGNWIWDIRNNRLEWTDQLYKIYGLKPQSEVITIDRFLSFVHPEDKALIEKGIDEIYHKEHLDYSFRIITGDGKVKNLRSIAQVDKDDKGRPVKVVGTERDTTEKQTLFDQLRRSEQLYKQAEALAHLGNWMIDLKTGIFTWSEEMYKIYELGKGEEFTSKEWEAYIHPDEKEEVLNYVRKCIAERSNYDKIHRIVLPSGKIKTIRRKAELIYNNNGEPVSMIGTTQDVSEEYRIQQELKDNQTFIRKITDATPSIIASYNVNTGKYVFISEGLGKLLGYETKEVMERGVEFFAGIIHPDDLMPLLEKNAIALEDANNDPEKNDIVIEFTYRMRHRNGNYRWFQTYGTIFDRNSEGKIDHVLNISLDITEQKEATEKIREQEHFIQQIADASPTILYLYDKDNESIAYINREIFFVLGYLPEEIIDTGSSITEFLYHPEDIQLLPGRKASGKVFQQVDSMIQYECRMKNKQGEWRWLLVREIVFKTDEKGNIKQILGAALDINRRKEMERTILQNTLLLEQSNASLEEFAYVASHDLKEPLRKIATFGDRLIAMQEDKLSADGKIYLKKIVDASQRMQTMISDLLSISMITGNKSFERYSLQKIFEETLQTLEFRIEQLNAEINGLELPEALIIPSQFRQLFQNLLSNSLKFVRQGVRPVINITWTYVSPADITPYHLRQANRYLKLEFADNGLGFENEFAGKIFAIFQRLHGRSEYEGSGIGLAICKKIVEHHGGVIYARGVPEQGSTFIIILPA